MNLIRRIMNRLFARRHTLVLCNVAEGTHEGNVTRLTDAAITTRHLLMQGGSDEQHVAVNDADTLPAGVCTDEAAAAELEVNIALPGCASSTLLMVASEQIAALAEVYTAANGKIQNLPAVAGTYYRVGRTLLAAAADGDEVEVDPYPPTELVVP